MNPILSKASIQRFFKPLKHAYIKENTNKKGCKYELWYLIKELTERFEYVIISKGGHGIGLSQEASRMETEIENVNSSLKFLK